MAIFCSHRVCVIRILPGSYLTRVGVRGASSKIIGYRAKNYPVELPLKTPYVATACRAPGSAPTLQEAPCPLSGRVPEAGQMRGVRLAQAFQALLGRGEPQIDLYLLPPKCTGNALRLSSHLPTCLYPREHPAGAVFCQQERCHHHV